MMSNVKLIQFLLIFHILHLYHGDFCDIYFKGVIRKRFFICGNSKLRCLEHWILFVWFRATEKEGHFAMQNHTRQKGIGQGPLSHLLLALGEARRAQSSFQFNLYRMFDWSLFTFRYFWWRPEGGKNRPRRTIWFPPIHRIWSAADKVTLQKSGKI